MWAWGWIVVVLGTLVADAEIVRRHDRPDSDYLELGARFPAVAKLGGRMGDGTLIRPQWILTAAHVADGMLRRDAPSVVIEGVSYEARDIYLHPSWRQMGPHDIALLRLDRPVEGVAPMLLYRGSGEEGEVATLVGHGMNGEGLTGPDGEDGLRRGATNRVERADERHLLFVFDEGDAGTRLEGIPAGGDSGGPALLVVDGEYQIAGVSSMGEPGRNGPATYGARDYFGRVSTHLGWVDGVLAGRGTPTTAPAAGGQVVEATRPVGRSPREQLIRSVVDAFGPDAEVTSMERLRDHFVESLKQEYDRGALGAEFERIRVLLSDATEVDVGFGGGGFDLTIIGAEGRLGVVEIRIADGAPPKIGGLRVRRRAPLGLGVS